MGNKNRTAQPRAPTLFACLAGGGLRKRRRMGHPKAEEGKKCEATGGIGEEKTSSTYLLLSPSYMLGPCIARRLLRALYGV